MIITFAFMIKVTDVNYCNLDLKSAADAKRDTKVTFQNEDI